MSPLGETARCWSCKVYGSSWDLELNRTNWEYECRDKSACQDRVNNPELVKQNEYKRRSNAKKKRNRKV